MCPLLLSCQGDVDMLLNFLCSAHEHNIPLDNLVVFGGDQVSHFAPIQERLLLILTLHRNPRWCEQGSEQLDSKSRMTT